MASVIDAVCHRIASTTDARIILLRNKEVIQWLFADLSFLPPIEKKTKQPTKNYTKNMKTNGAKKSFAHVVLI